MLITWRDSALCGRSSLVAAIAVTIFIAGGCAERISSKSISDRFNERLRTATSVRFAISGVDAHGDRSAVIKDANVVKQCVEQVTQLRRWRRRPGVVTESRMIRIEFLDDKEGVLAEFVILGRSLVVIEDGASPLEADWPEGLSWAMELIKGTEKADK